MSPLDLPFDIYQRYRLVSETIRAWEEGIGVALEPILDVGGLPGKLAMFLPEHRIVVCDPGDGPASVPWVRGDAASLPFADGAFGVSVCIDTLEHLAAEQREATVDEMQRVGGGRIVLGGPFAGDPVESAEAEANAVYRALTGEDHPWLEEHAANELPVLEELEHWLGEADLDFASFPNGYLPHWRVPISSSSTSKSAETIVPS